MPLKWRFDILPALKARGYNTNRIRSEKILSESTLQKLREGQGLSWSTIETLCKLLQKQPGELLIYIPDNGEGE